MYLYPRTFYVRFTPCGVPRSVTCHPFLHYSGTSSLSHPLRSKGSTYPCHLCNETAAFISSHFNKKTPVAFFLTSLLPFSSHAAFHVFLLLRRFGCSIIFHSNIFLLIFIPVFMLACLVSKKSFACNIFVTLWCKVAF